MGIKVYLVDCNASPAGWPYLDSSTGTVSITNDGLQAVLIGSTSWSSPSTVSSGYVLNPGETHEFPSDDGSSGTRIGYAVIYNAARSNIATLTVIANGG